MKNSVLLMIVLMVTGEATPEITHHVSNGTVSVVGNIARDDQRMINMQNSIRCIDVCRKNSCCRCQMSKFQDHHLYNDATWIFKHEATYIRVHAHRVACVYDSAKGKYECTFAMDSFKHVFSLGLFYIGTKLDTANCIMLNASIADSVDPLFPDRRPLKNVLAYGDAGMDSFVQNKAFSFSLTCSESLRHLWLYVVRYSCAYE